MSAAQLDSSLTCHCEQPLVSVIVPAYNSQDFLEACLESLRSQTLHNIEIICVNDGSTDNTANLLEQAAAQDSRIVVVSQKNAGLGCARNAGVAAAHGKIIMLCDADDMLKPQACEHVYQQFEQSDCTAVVFGFEIFPETALHPSLASQLHPRDVVITKSNRGIEQLLFEEKARPFAWRIALRAKFMQEQHICFHPELTLGEDQYFCFEVYPRSSKTVLMSEQLYLYRMNNQSMTHTIGSGVDARLVKLSKHLACEQAIIQDWTNACFMGICDEKILEWCLDLLLLDVSKLPAQNQVSFWEQWRTEVLSRFSLQEIMSSHKFSSAAKACVTDILSDTHLVSKRHLAMFYLHKRGMVSSMKRVVWGLTHKA
ncbi:glycosyltransferase family 2 protein [Atopobium fossor]|uniref:glycosyltransferase family 2 protein n=1 Tax=Atopobium fossor TaxID=39487 RepID=UPI00146FA2EE|nr:glycosyltransferase family 2 protein [Atopobium fossor]